MSWKELIATLIIGWKELIATLGMGWIVTFIMDWKEF